MPGSVVQRLNLTMRIRDLLRDDGLSCDVARPPRPPENQRTPSLPYVIVYPLTGGEPIGPALSSPDSFAQLAYQFTCVGKSAHQCEALADRVCRILVGRTDDESQYLTDLNAEGLRVTGRWWEGPGDLDDQTPIMSRPDRYRFGVAAA